MQAFISLLPSGLVPTNGHTNNEGERHDNSYLNVNKITGNSEKSSDETQSLLTPHRQEQWINATTSDMFDNPAKVLHTTLNWFNARVTEAELRAIMQFRNLYEPKELIRDISNFCLTKNITLKRGNKSPKELFSCNELESNPIIVVTMATKHPFEKGVCWMPNQPIFVQIAAPPGRAA